MSNDNKWCTVETEGVTGSLDIKESHVNGDIIASSFEQILKSIGINMSINYEHHNVDKRLEPKWVFYFALKE